MEPVEKPGGAPVLIVSPDERWLRALEVTIRLGGHRVISRRSMADVPRVRDGDDLPRAMVFDLGANWTAQELETIRSLMSETSIPAVVILPERLAAERDRVAAVGAATLIRPYRPSELFALLPPPDGEPEEGDSWAGADTSPADALATPAVEPDEAPAAPVSPAAPDS